MIFQVAEVLALAGTAAIVGLAASQCIAKHPQLGLALLASLTLVQWEFAQPDPLFSVGGSAVYLYDLCCMVLLAASLLSVRSNPGTPRGGVAYWLLGAGLFVSLVVGVTVNGFGAAVTEARPIIWAVAVTTWSLSVNWTEEFLSSTLPKWGRAIALSLSGVAILHIGQYGLGAADSFVEDVDGLIQTTRPLVAGQALFLAIAIIWLLHLRRPSRFDMLVVAIAFAVLFLSQQRTAWVAAAAGLAFVWLHNPEARRLLGWVAAASGTTVLLLGAFATADSSILQSISHSTTSAGTYEGRLESWRALLEQSWASGWTTVLLGEPFGSGFGRFEGVGRYVTFAPHNWYITIYLRVGILGLIVLAGFTVSLLLRNRTSTLKSAPIMLLIVFGWAYSWPWYCCLILGIAGRAAAAGKLARDHGRVPLNGRTGRSLGGGRSLVGGD